MDGFSRDFFWKKTYFMGKSMVSGQDVPLKQAIELFVSSILISCLSSSTTRIIYGWKPMVFTIFPPFSHGFPTVFPTVFRCSAGLCAAATLRALVGVSGSGSDGGGALASLAAPLHLDVPPKALYPSALVPWLRGVAGDYATQYIYIYVYVCICMYIDRYICYVYRYFRVLERDRLIDR